MAGADDTTSLSDDGLEDSFTDGALDLLFEAVLRGPTPPPTEVPSNAQAQAFRDLRMDFGKLLELQPENLDPADTDTHLINACACRLKLHDFERHGGGSYPLTREAYRGICNELIDLAVCFCVRHDQAETAAMSLLESHNDGGCDGSDCNVADELKKQAAAAREKALEVKAWVTEIDESAKVTDLEAFGPEPEDTATSLTTAAPAE